MGSFCYFCGDQRSMVYCRSDAASLCLSCDFNVHSANSLSSRHYRALLCERCYSQPVTVRYIEDSISLCHICDWNGHRSSSGHKERTINFLCRCPSASELVDIWSLVFESSPMEDSCCEQGMGMLSIKENIASTFWGHFPNSCNSNMTFISRSNKFETAAKLIKNRNPPLEAESGSFVLWQVAPEMWSFLEIREHFLVSSLVISWSITEIIRYSFFGMKEALDSSPYWHLWLGYSAILIMFRMGISSEVGLYLDKLEELQLSEGFVVRVFQHHVYGKCLVSFFKWAIIKEESMKSLRALGILVDTISAYDEIRELGKMKGLAKKTRQEKTEIVADI